MKLSFVNWQVHKIGLTDFFINMTLYEIARTTSGRDREIYERRLNESDVTEVRLTI